MGQRRQRAGPLLGGVGRRFTNWLSALASSSLRDSDSCVPRRSAGFLDKSELFITGRLKDMLVVRGRNIYPQDIEAIAEAAAPGLRTNANAAFAIDRDDAEDEAVVLIQEVSRTSRHENLAPIAAAIRRAVFAELEIALHDVLIVEPGTVPKTSSGKTRRAEAKRGYLLCKTAERVAVAAEPCCAQIHGSKGDGPSGLAA